MNKKITADRTPVLNAVATMSDREHRSLVIDYNKSAAPWPSDKTIVDLFESQVERTPNDEAIRLGNESLTYARLNERANQFARQLLELGAGPERIVTLYM